MGIHEAEELVLEPHPTLVVEAAKVDGTAEASSTTPSSVASARHDDRGGEGLAPHGSVLGGLREPFGALTAMAVHVPKAFKCMNGVGSCERNISKPNIISERY